MTSPIYHITSREAWEAARKVGEYAADSLTEQGFIHCSKIDQVLRVANSLYHARTDLLLLEIDPERIRVEVRWEPGADKPDELFPHIYGPLNLEAVKRVLDLPPGSDGNFTLPTL
jgi:uncharacterized protein (DUF952 family)